jgi:hypothetical protein
VKWILGEKEVLDKMMQAMTHIPAKDKEAVRAEAYSIFTEFK